MYYISVIIYYIFNVSIYIIYYISAIIYYISAILYSVLNTSPASVIYTQLNGFKLLFLFNDNKDNYGIWEWWWYQL